MHRLRIFGFLRIKGIKGTVLMIPFYRFAAEYLLIYYGRKM